MRLLNTRTLEFAEYLGSAIPPYAILSHTWEDGEVTLREMTEHLPSVTSKKGYRKIIDHCLLAAQQGYAWAWVDTCCIDKTNHAELTESINSMFRWYQDAAICHVFLSDISADAGFKAALPRCRWFTRGWTLQELIAPATVEFYDQSWALMGTKANLITELAAITGILEQVLEGTLALRDLSVGVRMSWAANRETTRPEDMAYSLLGIFDVNMPMIYGEGKKAFRRLQEEIIRQSNDLTIFACEHQQEPDSTGLENNKRVPSDPMLALSPRDFEIHSTRKSPGLLRTLGVDNRWKWSELDPEYAITNKGLRITASLVQLPIPDPNCTTGPLYFFALGEIQSSPERTSGDVIGMVLTKVAPNAFVRRRGPLFRVPSSFHPMGPVLSPSLEIYIGMGDDRFSSSIGWVSRHWVIMVRSGRLPVRLWSTNQTEDVPRDGPSHALVQIAKAVPESHWDQTNQRFFASLRYPLVFAVSFCIRLAGHDISLICLIEQHGQYWIPSLFIASENRELSGWFFSRKASTVGTFWEDLPGYRALVRRESVQVDVDGLIYCIRAERRDKHQDDSHDTQQPSTTAISDLSLDITQFGPA